MVRGFLSVGPMPSATQGPTVPRKSWFRCWTLNSGGKGG
jgi:hypothetical protein